MPGPFEFPAWAAILFGPKAPARPDLPTTDAEIAPLVEPKRKVGRPAGKYGQYKPRKAKEAA